MKKKAILIFLLWPMLSFAPNITGSLFDSKSDFITTVAKEVKIEQRIKEIKQSEFSYDLLKEYVQLLGLNKIVIKQSILETGWFKSKSFLLYNNLFGMKVPITRDNLVIGVGLNHAVYEHWTDSVEDYLKWYIFYIRKMYVIHDYYTFLDSVKYAEDPDYTKKLKSIKL